jgi:integrase
MGVYKRGNKLWISYAVPAEMAAEHGCQRTIRESAETGDSKAAARLLAQRRREIRDGTWRPAKLGGHGLTLETYAERWSAQRVRSGVRSATRDLERLAPLLAIIGKRRIGEIKRTDVRNAIVEMRNQLGKRGKAKGKPYSPMTIHRAYGVLRALFGEAQREEIVVVNPCTLRALAGDLPARKDADPRWRALAVFTREEVQLLLSDQRVPETRRVLYALLFFCGLRIGEAVARTWGDYDDKATPLGRLTVATQHEGRDLKTEKPRDVPVHPELARVLAVWRERYRLVFGAEPTPDALIILNRFQNRMLPNACLENLRRDLRVLGLRRRRVHDLRRTLITLARADGARPDLLRWVTHGGGGAGIMDTYMTPVWSSLCEQISCVRVKVSGFPSDGTQS